MLKFKFLSVLILFSFFLTTESTFAVVEIKDPQKLISQAQALLAQTSFTEFFKKDSAATFIRYIESCEYNCQDGPMGPMCISTCKESPQAIERKVIEQSNDKAVIYGIEDGFYKEYTPEDFQANRAYQGLTPFKILMSSLIYPAKLKLRS